MKDLVSTFYKPLSMLLFQSPDFRSRFQTRFLDRNPGVRPYFKQSKTLTKS